MRGVPVFFFLSGLFIARSLERYNTAEFLKRRVIRIFLELWVCVISNLVIILITYEGRHTFKDIIIYLATQMTAFQFYTGKWLREYGVGVPNGALWTITADIQFYIVAIFLAKWLKERKIYTWGVIIGLIMILDLRWKRSRDYIQKLDINYYNAIWFLWIFLLGMCFYYNRDRLIPVFTKLKWLFVALYLIWQFVVPSPIVKVFGGVRYNVVTTILMLFMFTGIGFSFNRRFRQDYSYSYYLYHMVVINFMINNMVRTFDSNGQFILTLITFMVTIDILAVLSHKYVAGTITKKNEKKLL